MLKAPDHQVAGHQAGGGMLGPLVDDSGHFFKPLQDDDRGSREVAFYTSFASNAKVPGHIRRYFPVFYGTQTLEASDRSGLHEHLVLQDLVSNRLNPSVMDIKIGARTWYPQASEDYVLKRLKKDRRTTSASLGFRISGLQAYESKESGYWKPDRKKIQSFNVDDVRSCLRRFASPNPLSDSKPNRSLAPVIYGGSDGILAQLLELKAWFEVQTFYDFNSCSVLMIYEKDAVKGVVTRAEVKLIDFAHVMDGQGIIDHNFLGGLCSLINFVSEMLATEGGPNGCEKNQSCLQNGPKKEKQQPC